MELEIGLCFNTDSKYKGFFWIKNKNKLVFPKSTYWAFYFFKNNYRDLRIQTYSSKTKTKLFFTKVHIRAFNIFKEQLSKYENTNLRFQ